MLRDNKIYSYSIKKTITNGINDKNKRAAKQHKTKLTYLFNAKKIVILLALLTKSGKRIGRCFSSFDPRPRNNLKQMTQTVNSNFD